MRRTEVRPGAAAFVAFAVHLVHVLSMALIVGGLTAGSLGAASRRLEWAFWGATGAIVATGVGNLGRHGDLLPGLGMTWGIVLLVKLLLVLLLLGLSLRRSVAVWAGVDARGWYHATAAIAVVLAGLGVWLAHG